MISLCPSEAMRQRDTCRLFRLVSYLIGTEKAEKLIVLPLFDGTDELGEIFSALNVR